MRKQDLPNCPQWLLDANTENEDVEYDIYGRVQWNSGDFRGGDFWGGNFWGGDFWGGDFRDGDFRGGNFWGGNFRGGNFRGGDFRGGNFWGGNMYAHCKWFVGLTAEGLVKIGCKIKTFKEWDAWFLGTESFSTQRSTKEFAKIQAMYESVKAYTTFLEDFNKDK